MSEYHRLVQQIEIQGGALFRWRGLIGAALLPPLAIAVWQPGWPGNLLQDHAIDMLTGIGLVISLLGLALRWFTVGRVPAGTSGRNTREQRAAALNTTGMYSIVRHPLYVANAIIVTGFTIATASLWFLLLFWLSYTLCIERIVAPEEHFLQRSYGDRYQRWATLTPAFLPRLKQWQPSGLPYSIRTVLRREYNGFFGVSLAFFLLEAVRDVGLAHEPVKAWLADESVWTILLALGLIVFAVLRSLKRRTRQLHVHGR